MMSKQELETLIEQLKDCSAALNRLAKHLQEAAGTPGDVSFDEISDNTFDDTADNEDNSGITDSVIDIALDVEVTAPPILPDMFNLTEGGASTADDPIEIAAEEVPEVKAEESSPKAAAGGQNAANSSGSSQNNVQASAANPFARLFAGLNLGGGVPSGANPFNLMNMLAGGKGGLPGLGGLAGMGGGNLPSTLAELHDNPQLMNMLSQVANNPQSLNVMSGLTGQSPEALQAALNSLQPAAAPIAPTAPANATPAAVAQPMLTLNPAAIAAPQMMTNPSATAHLDSLLAEWHWAPYARVWGR